MPMCNEGSEGYTTVFCLFCQTGHEAAVAELVNVSGWGEAIFPRRMKTVLVNDRWEEKPVAMLPGYVFVYTRQEVPDYTHVRNLSKAIRILTYDDTGSNALRGSDLTLAEKVWQQGGIIAPLEAIQEGDRVEITDGLLKDLCGTVVRMDRRRKTVQVKLEGTGSIRLLWLTYKLVEKAEDSPSGKENQMDR